MEIYENENRFDGGGEFSILLGDPFEKDDSLVCINTVCNKCAKENSMVLTSYDTKRKVIEGQCFLCNSEYYWKIKKETKFYKE